MAADARQKQAAKLRCPSNALRGRSPRDAANQKLMEELVQKTNRQAVAVHNEDKIGICMTIHKRTITS